MTSHFHLVLALVMRGSVRLCPIYALTLSDPMSDLIRYNEFPVPDTFLDL
jgi:hypothetical protein